MKMLSQSFIGSISAMSGKSDAQYFVRDDLDDMCQDTFLLAFTRLHSFEGTCQFRTWIARIATTQCLQTLRKVRQASNGESNLIQIHPELTADGLRRRR